MTTDACQIQSPSHAEGAALHLEREPVVQHSSPAAKIALFRSLFRGREDVYPRRFESRKTGKSGYAPACGNEWVRGVCEKPRIKCADCPNRRFLAVTDEVIRFLITKPDLKKIAKAEALREEKAAKQAARGDRAGEDDDEKSDDEEEERPRRRNRDDEK